MKLDERKRLVLRAIVEDYIASALPVGSRTIARKYRLGVSPATIRNEMADLEEMGLLEQPHTSAGRIPSDKGYRLYVDTLMQRINLSLDELRQIREIYERRTQEIEALIQETIKVLCDTTNYMALVLGPGVSATPVKRIGLVPMTEKSAVLVLVTEAGFVANRLLEVPEGIREEDLYHISGVLSHHLQGLTLDRLSLTAIRELYNELARYRSIVEQTLEILSGICASQESERVWVGGALRILDQPEFRDIDKAKAILGLIEDVNLLRESVSNFRGKSGVQVTIGVENDLEDLKDCSLVSATYWMGSKPVGTVALLGPKRMNYSKAVAVVEVVEETLSEVFTKVVGA
ncbi:MAG TPA: heat-inducible transcription repressor HrcA [Clostridia bacterium]|nr:heat-inducible transcription repressor HrcA [Clostridia bacterium]